MIYLDANIFVNAIIGDDKKSCACLEILRKIVDGKVVGQTSVLTWDEFFFTLKKIIGREKATEESKEFLNMPNLILLNASPAIVKRAQKIVEKYAVNPRDAIHAATAIINNADGIVTDDADFDKIKEIKRIKI